jgi:transposase
VCEVVDEDMQTKRENRQESLMLLPPLESFIPRDHYLWKLNQILELGFVHDAVRGHYCQDNGRPSIDPEVIIRLFLLQAIEGISHVRELMRQVQVNLAYRWFIGYGLEESLPDHSTLSRSLDRFGDEIFDKLFARSIGQCQASGLIGGRVVHVDATTIRADLDANRVGKDDSPDGDARFGRFPDGTKRPGYKQETVVDDRYRVIVGLSVYAANRADDAELVPLLDEVSDRLGGHVEAVCGDGAYGSGKNRAELGDRDIRLVSPPARAGDGRGAGYFTVADFTYDEDRDEFICPAGKQLKYVGTDNDPRRKRRRYCARRSHCRICSLQDKCTLSDRRTLKVGIHYAALQQLRADSHTESFRDLYRRRAPVVEGVFAEAKQWHGLRRAWRRGLAKMRIQCLLTAAAINFKRLAAVLGRFLGRRGTLLIIIEFIRRLFRIISYQYTIPRATYYQ